MKKYTDPIRCGTYHHIFNRGINGEDIFTEERNYTYFLTKYALYVYPVAQTFAYCLLRNHFHLLIRTRDAGEILSNLNKQTGAEFGEIEQVLLAEKCISLQFSKLFNGYAQAFNKSNNRHGGLFEEPFRRKPIESDRYFGSVAHYIHMNPINHGFCTDLRLYKHSSYPSILTDKPSKLEREGILDWFGGKSGFEMAHMQPSELDEVFRIE